MFKKSIITLGLSLISGISISQKDPVIMTVNGKSVTKSEFLEVYLKNNDDPKYDQASLDEYMDLYRKFKLIVTEAEEIQLDTTRSLFLELKGYETQLSKQYLIDNEATEELIKEAYENLKTEVRASHILRTIDPDASPKDTLKVYNQIMQVRKDIIDGKKTFEEACLGLGGSEDPSAKKNKGDLGYFGAFQMVYEFEKAAYSTKVGDITMPVRTKFGYHIIKVTDKREARGLIKVEHIMLIDQKKPANQNVEMIDGNAKMIQEIYDTIQKGLDFQQAIMLYSEDIQSKKKGGVLPEFGSGSQIRMVPEFEDAAFALKKDGEISKPFKTAFGWHIVRRVSLTPLKSFEELERELKLKVQKDSRSKISETSFLNKLKAEYKFKDYSAKNLQIFYDSITTDIFKKEFKGFKLGKDQTLFTFKGQEKPYKQSMLLAHIVNNQEKGELQNMEVYVNKIYKDIVKFYLKQYEKSQLTVKYPKFNALMKEYKDGVLLFELKNRNVWKKAIEDTTGLKTFFTANQSKYNWPERIDAIVFECFNKEALTKLNTLLSSDLDPNSIRDSINSQSQLNIRVTQGKYVQAENELLKGQDLKVGINPSFEKDGKQIVVKVISTVEPGPKELNDCRGQVIAAYQDELEKNWIQSLEKKYEVVINKDVLYSLSK